MKIRFITLLALIMTLSASAQIQKVHTFNSGDVRYSLVNANEGYFTVLDGQKLRLYATDYTLHKEVNLPAKANSEVISISSLSKNLFDQNESNFEFVVRYRDTVDFNGTYAIVRENGNTLRQFNNFPRVLEINGEPKILVRLENETEVYSLPGELTSNLPIKGNGGNVGNVELYPNPASEQVTLLYDLAGDQRAQIKIYRATGHLQEQVRVGPDFDHIKLDVSDYKAGNYFYQVVVNEEVVYKGKFVVVN